MAQKEIGDLVTDITKGLEAAGFSVEDAVPEPVGSMQGEEYRDDSPWSIYFSKPGGESSFGSAEYLLTVVRSGKDNLGLDWTVISQHSVEDLVFGGQSSEPTEIVSSIQGTIKMGWIKTAREVGDIVVIRDLPKAGEAVSEDTFEVRILSVDGDQYTGEDIAFPPGRFSPHEMRFTEDDIVRDV